MQAIEDLDNFREFVGELYESGDLELGAAYLGCVLIGIYAVWTYGCSCRKEGDSDSDSGSDSDS
eukprot:8308691-Pyramimonas_sp.AAC.1